MLRLLTHDQRICAACRLIRKCHCMTGTGVTLLTSISRHGCDLCMPLLLIYLLKPAFQLDSMRFCLVGYSALPERGTKLCDARIICGPNQGSVSSSMCCNPLLQILSVMAPVPESAPYGYQLKAHRLKHKLKKPYKPRKVHQI